MRNCLITLLMFSVENLPCSCGGDAEIIDIGTRRELFTDTFLIDELRNAQRELHHPVPQKIAVLHDAAWEGAGSGYHTVIRDGDIYRMYYRGSAL
ncbi:MAG: hypothetical protein GY826_18705, partial [Fuerstiella sp.]|nr:hypothetical protein [Fuerstiella sp.]